VSAPETTAGKVGRIGLNLAAVLGFVYLFLPIVIIVVFSFNDPAGKFNIIWRKFTLDNWSDPFAPGPLMDAMVVSLKVAAISALGATILGSLIAIALVRYRFKGGKAVDLLLVLPLTTPEIVLGASLLSLFIDLNQQRGFWTIVIAHILFCTSFVALTVKARIRGLDWTLEDAAMDLGATPSRTFRKITLPMITPGVLAAFLLSFALSIDDFIITFFNAGSTETFPIRIFGASRTEISPQINVLATVILFVSIFVLLVGVVFKAYLEGRSVRAAAAGD
jgi:spermidine/putrescine transport system permease protein